MTGIVMQEQEKGNGAATVLFGIQESLKHKAAESYSGAGEQGD